jgi:cystathionine beta-lyase
MSKPSRPGEGKAEESRPRDDAMPDFETLCAHWGEDRTKNRGAVIPPIYQNSLFTFPDCATWMGPRGPEEDHYYYTRHSNPTTEVAETKIAALEDGDRARCFGSGMAAIAAAILACVKAGDHVIAPRTVYGPTRQFLESYLPRFQVTTTLVDGCDPQEWADALRPNTTLLYLESPSSVVMKQQDLEAVAAIAKAHGAATICDNSWASPYFQNPLRWGIDLVVHSATKYLGGHSDIVAGVVIGGGERMERLITEEGQLIGGILDPFAAWLLIRGLRTLPIRMERHQQNAMRIALALQAHPAVAAVYYPGLPSYPQGDLTCKQLRGTSGLFSFELKQQGREATHAFADALRYFGLGCSWGGFESLVVPTVMPAHAVGATDGKSHWVVRLHIGLESADDLWDDLESALKTK